MCGERRQVIRYRTLEDVLVGEGHLSRSALDRALAQQNGVRGGLGWHLVDGGLLSEDALVRALSRLYDLPVVDLAATPLESGVLEAFPLERMRRDLFLPLRHEGDRLVVAVADPGNVLLRDDLAQWCGGPVDLVLATRTALLERLGRVDASQRVLKAITEDFKLEAEDDGERVLSLEALPPDASPTIRLVDTILLTALERRASDVHIQASEERVQVKFRVDGMLRPAMEPLDRRHLDTIVSRVKIMAELDIAEHRVPQDGRFKLKVRGRSIDFRVSILPSNFGEAVVIRILDKEAITQELADLRLDILGIRDADLRRLRRHIHRPHGMVLVTGPTGSGKTTTVYAAISEIHTGHDKIITIEDPIEYQLRDVVQIPVNEKKGLTFARGLRSILRHDPDKILVGEIRDPETAQIAVQSALTGHLVFTTVHANNVMDVIGRFLNMGLEPYHFLSSLNCILTQRLVRVLCHACRRPVRYPREALAELGLEADRDAVQTFYEAAGCEECHGTGFRGRTAVAELVEMTDPIRTLIMDRRPASEIAGAARAGGTVLLRAGALEKARAGGTTVAEINRVTFA
ncbi:MAG: Flp pilus assembly complex ATPase component TadA, partial [candidate division NC10 bacterium]|nr:Flp pilus assembly complex ATPase component TadA [candidate division NC10 bacterium]